MFIWFFQNTTSKQKFILNKHNNGSSFNGATVINYTKLIVWLNN